MTNPKELYEALNKGQELLSEMRKEARELSATSEHDDEAAAKKTGASTPAPKKDRIKGC